MTETAIRVLLVEDSPTDAELVKLGLERQADGDSEFRIFHVERLRQAVEVLDAGEPFDVILLDLGLPDATGLQALWGILAQGGDIPVIVLTGLADRRLGAEAVRLGAQDYLTKGLANAPILVQAIEYAIERAQRMREFVTEIEERKKAETRLRESETRFRDFTEAASDWFWETDAEHRLTFISDRFFELSGLEPGRILSRLPGDVGCGARGAAPWQRYVAQFKRFDPFRAVPFDARFGDGSIRHISVSGKPFLDGDGRFRGYRGTGGDVTQVVEDRRELVEKSAIIQRAFENLDEGFALYDDEDRLVTCNARFLDFNPGLRGTAVPGARREDLIRANVYGGTIQDAIGREESYISELYERLRRSSASFERNLSDGRSLMVVHQRFEDGSSCFVETDITELKASEKEAQLGAATLEATFRSVSQGIAVYDSDLRVIACNQRYVELASLPPELCRVGASAEEIMRVRAERGDYGPIDDIGEVVRAQLETLRNGSPLKYEFKQLDGRVVEMQGQAADAGRYVLTYTDVTYRARREQEMGLLLAAGQAITAARDAEAALKGGLREIGEALGWPYAEAWRPDSGNEVLIQSTSWFAGDDDLRPFPSPEHTAKFSRDVGLIGRIWEQGEAEWIPDLREVDAEAYLRLDAALEANLRGVLGVPVRSSAGDILAVLCFYMPEVRAEEERLIRIVEAVAGQLGIYIEKKFAEDALRGSEDRFRAFAEAASDYFTILDENLKYSYISPRTCEIFGIDPARVVGAERGDLLTLGPGQEVSFEGHRRALAAHEPFRDFVFAAHATDGTLRHIRSSGRPIFGPDGRFRGYYSVGADITDHKQLEAQLHQAQKMEAVGQLTGGVAHDFNNLLTVVMGNLQLLERRVRGDARNEKHIGMALGAAQRGAELTNRLLAFSRRQVLEPKSANLNELVNGLVPLLKRTLGETIGLDLRLDGTLRTVRIDVAQFESALLNLTVNARDAMPDGGKLSVETRNVMLNHAKAAELPDLPPGPYVVVSATDTGSGIPREIVDRVFEPVFTTKEVGKGSGLGLSMVYGFAKQSGGNVTIYSEEGMGTTVRLYFPCMEEEDAGADAAPALETIVPGGDETILLVEDETAVRETVALILEDYGYTVIVAENGPSALEALEHWDRVDLLLTDVVMPGGMNGRQLADRVREIHPTLKVLITSGYPQETISKEGILEEGIAFIGKPYDHDDLARKLRELLDE